MSEAFNSKIISRSTCAVAKLLFESSAKAFILKWCCLKPPILKNVLESGARAEPQMRSGEYLLEAQRKFSKLHILVFEITIVKTFVKYDIINQYFLQFSPP